MEARYFVSLEGEPRIARLLGAEVAYLGGDGWVKPAQGSRLEAVLLGEADGHPEADGWVEFGAEEARCFQRGFFSQVPLDAPVVRGPKRATNYLSARGFRWRRRAAPFGPMPRTVPRELQAAVQAETRDGLPSELVGEPLEELIGEAQRGFERQESRIEGIQQRASFFLGATGLTTSLILVNGSLLYGQSPLEPRGVLIAVGVLLMLAALALVVAGVAALDATTISFDRTLPSSAWQIERRLGLENSEAQRDLLAALLLAGRRAEGIGDWKLRQLMAARLAFACAVVLVVIASLTVLLAALV